MKNKRGSDQLVLKDLDSVAELKIWSFVVNYRIYYQEHTSATHSPEPGRGVVGVVEATTKPSTMTAIIQYHHPEQLQNKDRCSVSLTFLYAHKVDFTP